MSAARHFIAIIGGSGLYHLQQADAPLHTFTTPYASEAVELFLEDSMAGPLWFLPRHGKNHSIAPHEINYRANLWALQQAGAGAIIAVNAVGGISAGMEPGTVLLPDQLIDYTWGREHSFFSGAHSFDKHIDFTEPYDAALRVRLMAAAASCKLALHSGGVYACTQGPRLETAAEVRRLARDGCDIVGMTGMPEAALARELGLPYASVALVVNRAAGLGEGVISVDAMREVMERGLQDVRQLLLTFLATLQKSDSDSIPASAGNS